MASSIVLAWRFETKEAKTLQVMPPDATTAVGPSSAAAKKLKDYQGIIDRDIFHTTAKPTSAKVGKSVKPSDMDLRLKGTVIGENRNSFAIIQDGTTMNEELYSVNDFVQGARIVEILADQVILSLKGSKEALIMAEETSPAVPRKRLKKRAAPPRAKPSRAKRPRRPKI
jgi:type II secretory pathway component PulC